MAYIDFSAEPTLAAYTGAPRSDPVQADAVHADEGRLSALEWSVVALARRDRLSSLSRPGRLSTALGRVFGTSAHNPALADPRLEALRRIAVLVWHHSFAVPARELTAFLAAGFSTAQFEAVAASVHAARSRRSARMNMHATIEAAPALWAEVGRGQPIGRSAAE